MDTPLYQALQALAAGDTLRMHMPGHKGRGIEPSLAGAMALDVTELPGTGNLYDGDAGSIIGRAERCWARRAGCGGAMLLTGGATLGIQAMLAAVCHPGDRVLLDRGSHQSALHAAALLDLQVDYLRPALAQPFGVSAGVTAEALAAALAGMETPPAAVLVTSPTYYGFCCDLPALAAVCHRHGAALLVDEAHGAHFPFVGRGSACALGADWAVASAHKTLPVLGGGALLYAAGDVAPGRRWAAVFGSSSPSYAVMASLDYARGWLDETGAYGPVPARVAALRRALAGRYAVVDGPDTDPCRLSVCTAVAGVTGFDAAEALRARGVEPELADGRNVVCIVTCQDTPADLARLQAALMALPERTPLPLPALSLPDPAVRCSPRQALFAPRETVPLAEAAGRIAARPVVPYPPGIPVIAPGEEISEKEIAYLHAAWYNKITHVEVLRAPLPSAGRGSPEVPP